MVQILKEIYADIELANCLGFKGGTAMMFFYDLPRFSVDLDFNLLCNKKEDIVYTKVRKIILKYGNIYDEAKNFYGPLIVLDYGVGERKLKVEISNRLFDNHYETKNFPGINMKVMVQSLYKISDPFMNFYFSFIVPNKSRLEFGLIEQVWNEINGKLKLKILCF